MKAFRPGRELRAAIETPVHGGDPETVAARYGPAGQWLDFSANINPAGPSQRVLAALRAEAVNLISLTRYPTPHDRELQRAIADAHGCREAHIVVGNGAAALIESFVRCVGPRRALVPQPAFSEYARALAAQGCEVVGLTLDAAAGFALDVPAAVAALERERPDACIITNPHNPSGAVISREALGHVMEAAASFGVALLIDEAFVDYAPDASLVNDVLAADGDVFVLRSLTKFYAMPALRVGFGIAPARFAHAIRGRVPSWPITSFASVAAIAAIGDDAFASEARMTNELERELLRARLGVRVRVLPSAANFVMIELPCAATELADIMARHHRIIVRDCSTYETLEGGRWIRVAVRSREENEAFVRALWETLPAGKFV
ncbi:MAG: threonine-phosphate decarboxylase CobD [Candidatus Velthaea sp.]